MRTARESMTVLAVSAILATGARADDRDEVRYEKYRRDPVLREIIEKMDSLSAVADSVTKEIDARFEAEREREKEERKVIRFDFEGIEKPASPGSFDAPFHFPPVAQYLTGMCWCYSTTSFLESEISRQTGREIKISELHTIYWEYVEKARGFVRKRGNQPIAQGGESDGVLLIWEKYGAVPAAVYDGLPGVDQRHNHSMLIDELRDYLHMCRDEGWWDEESVTAHVRLILDRYLGPPPEEFEYEGRKMSPTDFFRDVIRLDTSEYVQIMSTLSVPFHTMAEFDVPDNWRPTATYYNLPLDDFCRYIGKAARSGYTVCIGGDVSEPGYYGEEDAAVVPTFDIPFEYIDQDSRELRIYNGTTEDDHGVHLLAVTEAGDRDWFLIKDSARASRRGEHEGYIFYREDYVRLKMLTCMVHSDVLEEIIDRVEKARKQVGMRSSTRDLAY